MPTDRNKANIKNSIIKVTTENMYETSLFSLRFTLYFCEHWRNANKNGCSNFFLIIALACYIYNQKEYLFTWIFGSSINQLIENIKIALIYRNDFLYWIEWQYSMSKCCFTKNIRDVKIIKYLMVLPIKSVGSLIRRSSNENSKCRMM